MSAPLFVHLRLHTEYSIVDSTLRVGDTVALAANDAQVALAITDLNNLFGFVKFYKAARAKGIKPLCGVDAWIEAVDPAHEPSRLIFLAESHAGYLKLCAWMTRAFRDNQQRGRAMIKREWIADAAATEGVFCLSGGWFGEVGVALRNGQTSNAERAAKFWSSAFPERFAMEIHRAGFEDEHRFVQETVRLAGALQLPIVATHPMQFATAEDYKAHEARVCIAEGYTLGDTRRPRVFTEKQRFVTQAEMVEKFADYPQAVANTLLVAMRCNFEITLGKNYLPDFPLPEGVTVDLHLHEEVMTGLEKRLVVLYANEEQRAAERPRYVARCEFEIGVILKMGFPGYFLIVADFIAWAKNNGVPVDRKSVV